MRRIDADIQKQIWSVTGHALSTLDADNGS